MQHTAYFSSYYIAVGVCTSSASTVRWRAKWNVDVQSYEVLVKLNLIYITTVSYRIEIYSCFMSFFCRFSEINRCLIFTLIFLHLATTGLQMRFRQYSKHFEIWVLWANMKASTTFACVQQSRNDLLGICICYMANLPSLENINKLRHAWKKYHVEEANLQEGVKLQRYALCGTSSQHNRHCNNTTRPHHSKYVFRSSVSTT